MSVWTAATPAWREDLPPPSPAAPVLFLDRDGVVIVDRDYLADPAGAELIPGAAGAMRDAARAGYRLVGVSNQSGIGRGYYGEADFAAVQRRVDALLLAAGAGFDAFFYCPHAPEVGCPCRKPRTGLLDEAARRFSWPRRGSWLVGDKVADVACGRAAGLDAALVLTGQGAAERRRLPADLDCLVVADLAAAVAHVLRERPL